MRALREKPQGASDEVWPGKFGASLAAEGLPTSSIRGFFLGFDDLARFDAAGADANAFLSAADLCLDRLEIDVPAAAAHVVGVGDFVAELRTLTADFADLSHNQTPRFFPF